MSATATKLLKAIVARAVSLAILFGAIQGLRLRPADCASRESTCACAPRKADAQLLSGRDRFTAPAVEATETFDKPIAISYTLFLTNRWRRPAPTMPAMTFDTSRLPAHRPSRSHKLSQISADVVSWPAAF